MKLYGIWAVRGPGSVLGAAEAWCKRDGRPETFAARSVAENRARRLNEQTKSPNVHYAVRVYEEEE